MLGKRLGLERTILRDVQQEQKKAIFCKYYHALNTYQQVINFKHHIAACIRGQVSDNIYQVIRQQASHYKGHMWPKIRKRNNQNHV